MEAECFLIAMVLVSEGLGVNKFLLVYHLVVAAVSVDWD